jgi:hypothetical protein
MDEKGNSRRLRGLRAYLPDTVRFYALGNEKLTRIIFIVILITSFSSAFLQYNPVIDILSGFVAVTVIYLASAVYLAAYIKDLKGEEYSLKSCITTVSRSAGKVIAASINYLVTVCAVIGLLAAPEAAANVALFLAIPLTVVYLMFIFAPCFILDKGTGLTNAYAKSKKATSGRKLSIFLTMAGFNIIMAIPAYMVWVMAASSSNILIMNFVFAFTGAVLNLMQQRLTALMYVDLENLS